MAQITRLLLLWLLYEGHEQAEFKRGQQQAGVGNGDKGLFFPLLHSTCSGFVWATV